MNQKPDLHGYVLGELTDAERKEIDQFLASDANAALEVERLKLAHTALRRITEEEPPRRIAFVSDKVFEPKWWQAWWDSGPRLTLAAASMLTVAIIAHGILAKPIVAFGPDVEALVQARVEREVAKRLESAIARASVDIESRQQAKAREMIAVALKDADQKRIMLELSVEESFIHLRKQMGRFLKYSASADPGGPR